MKTANTSSNRNYNDVNHYLGISNEIEKGSREWYRAIKRSGYHYAYRWQNSNTDWMFFATNNARACEGAAELFAKEKKVDLIRAREYYWEYVNVYSLDHILSEWDLD